MGCFGVIARVFAAHGYRQSGHESRNKSDCNRFMLEARGRIDAATAGMTDEERLAWYSSRKYTEVP